MRTWPIALGVVGMIACGGNIRYEGGSAGPGGAAGGVSGSSVGSSGTGRASGSGGTTDVGSTSGITGTVGTGEGGASIGSSSAGAGGTTITGGDLFCNPNSAGPSQALWLTNRAYDNTIRDLLGDTSAPSIATGFPDDATFSGFRIDVDEGGSPSQIRLAHFLRGKDYLLARLTIDRASMAACPPMLSDADCATAFITDFAVRAYRRPLDTGEKSELASAYADGQLRGGFAEGIKNVIGTALISRHFLQLEEPKPSSPTATPLGPYAIASRLSYFIWRSMPDAELFASASSGKLSKPDEIERQARRMLADPKAHPAANDFLSEWLELDRLTASPWTNFSGVPKDAVIFPEFDSLRTSMRTETEKFGESILFGDQPMTNLLTSTITWVNQPLAALYGVGGFTTNDFRQGSVDPARRAGILTQASILSLYSYVADTGPTRRGAFISKKLLCIDVPPPPPSEPFSPPGSGTYRQRLEAMLAPPVCRACHVYLDGIGYAFESFDAIGHFRTTDAGLPIDDSAALPDGVDGAGPFRGAVELSRKLAASSTVSECMTKQMFRFALLRPETDEDCALRSLRAKLGPQPTFRDIVVALVTTSSFLNARW